MNAPIIRIEVEHMRQSMVHAFSKHVENTDAIFQQAITEACQPEKIQSIVSEAAERYLKAALEDEVKAFLLYGDGRALVRAEVEKRLKTDWPGCGK